ncbi:MULTISPECIES: 1-acyl-sn-glycerol-3-phosphate acyltransferase [unclassified Microcella]|uniref:lysophospholipid acyltransferase family protein n=1 Tax=unclassified Microcella TaxID=2630066 RepID=UPI00070194A0|nr:MULTISPECIES: lysophospholipid acyltransferase family protein [unclassified Microcella]KQV25775.1 acyl-phosphate glycerol 3-phosphate acyltransferase [Yonghaparkia sp. Root332]KRF33416.1 acyl-phosphate glycerol 3-phosphate acyltransferase [Yonghaparkia sp. Soil809]
MLTLLARLVLTPIARLVFRPVVIGRRRMPSSGGVVVASNHLSFIDSVVISLLAQRPVSFLAKSDYFTGRGLKGALSRAFFTGVGAIPVERGAGKAAQDALDAGLARLQAGQPFSIYPEGTRSRDGRLYRGKTGVAWLALTAGVPVVPVALRGTQDLQPVGSRRIRLARIRVEFGDPIDVSGFGPASSGRARRQATDAIMAEIQRMSGQEYAGVYNEPPAHGVVEKVRRAFRSRAEL